MEQTLTAKFQIMVSDEQKELLYSTMKAFADACSYVAEHVFRTRDLAAAHIQKDMYYEIRARFGMRAQMAQSCIRTVRAAYKAIKTSQHKWIMPRFRAPQLDLVWNRDYTLNKDKDRFSVNTLTGRIRVPFYSKGMDIHLADGCVYGTAKLVYKHGKFFLHIPVTREVEELRPEDVNNVVGVDRGIRFLATTYDSAGKTRFYDGKAVKQKRAHYKLKRSELQRVGTPSSRRRLKAIGQRENRWIHDVNHRISKALTEIDTGNNDRQALNTMFALDVNHRISNARTEINTDNNDGNALNTMFVLEDLTGIRSATERVRVHDRYVSASWPYYDLEQKLIYKALRNHQLVVKVDPAYTSQTCPKCGHREKANRDKKKHLFCCRSCGYSSNDDRIAAMNLHRMGIKLLLSTGCSCRGVNSPAQVRVNVP